jgi:hypothetical protein
MKMKTIRTIVMLMVISLVPMYALAEPSAPITKFMDTPASAFDIFLFHLQENGKCYQTFWGNPGNQKLDLCLTRLEYSYDDNIIEMNFFVNNSHKLLQGISGKPQKDKENVIKSILTDAAQIVGVEKIPSVGFFGWIQMVPIRHGWSTKNLDESEFRDEIRKRTRVLLYTDPIDGKRYKAVRSHHGEISIEPFK